MKALLAAILAMLLSAPQAAQRTLADPPSDGVSFDFTPRPDDTHQMPYIISVPVDGVARYIEYAGRDADAPAAHTVTFKVSTLTQQRLLSAYSSVARYTVQGSCDTKLKGIASTGKKVLTFYRDGHSISCTYDYSDDFSISGVTAAFQAIAETQQIGARLQHDLRYDRLSLDVDMQALVEENSAGRAIEMQSIATTLQSIIDDDRVLERVRRKATRLLQDSAPAEPKLPPPSPR